MDATVSPRILSGLIGSIYDCALNPDLWDETLLQIRDALNCHTAMLALIELPRGRLLISKAVGVPPDVREREERHAPEIAEMTQAYSGSLGPDEPFIISRHVPPEVFERSPYVRECVTPYGVVDMLQYKMVQTAARLAAVGFARHESQGTITEREVELGGLLLPHLRRAVTISNILDAHAIERARMAEALDALRCGVVLANADCAIVHANEAAEHMLHDSGPLQAAGGVLAAKSADATQELRDAIKLAARDETALGKTGLAVKLTGGETPIFAHVLPMKGSEIRTRLQPEAVAAVFIGAPEVEDGAVLVAEAFALTKGEKRVLSELLASRTLTESASELGISYATARTHLEAIFAKTGVKRQAELMRLAARFVPPARGAAR